MVFWYMTPCSLVIRPFWSPDRFMLTCTLMGVAEPIDRESIAIKMRVLNTATLAHSHENESAFYQQFASRGELGQVHCIAIEEVTGNGVPLTGSPADCR